ncbi:MAG: hypothetical protein COA84_07660 [Robiginitomaculum sp.]|nr:MAG: hypothetical protein COA84_07660 [Robiginitomaculum sp.]
MSVEVSQLKVAALGRMAELAVHFAPGGVRDGNRYWPPSTKAHKARGSLAIDVAGPHAGRWKDFGGDDGGDVIDFVSYFAFGSGGYKSKEQRGQAIGWLKNWLGMEDRPGQKYKAENPEAKKQRLAAAQSAQKKAERAEQERRNETAAKARSWWLSARKSGEDLRYSPVWAYLAGERHIPMDQLPRPPGALVWAKLSQAREDHVGYMLACMCDWQQTGTGCIRAVHMTALTDDGRKAALPVVKRMKGDVRGCAVFVSKGKSRLSPQMAESESEPYTLAITEGIEDALVVAALWPDWRVWAAGSLGNIGALALPPMAQEIHIFADNDPPDSKARAAYGKARNNLMAQAGSRAFYERRPVQAKDANEAWNGTK